MKNVFSKLQYRTTIMILFIGLLFSIGFFATIGTANVSPIDVYKIILYNIPLIGENIDISNLQASHLTIIWNIRLPRVLFGAIVGAALSTAGAAFQGMFKNPMADPYIIGISSGAALGATIGIILKMDKSFMNISPITLLSFLGGIIAVFLVYNIARIKNKVPVTTLLLAGVAVGQFFTAIMSFLMVIFDNDMNKIIYWTLGSLAGKGWEPIVRIGLPSIIGLLLIFMYARDLNIMLTGEESAQSLGVDVEKTKIYVLILGTFVTALSVSVSGIIGFVGLIIPHIVRLIIGPDHRILLPASALIGGIFMIFADTIARTVISPVEIPVGIITALFGGPFFIYLLKMKKRSI